MLDVRQSARTQKVKILVADDEADLLRLFRFVLSEAGYDVITAVNGVEALSKAQSEHPDLLILDVMMPEISGLEVCWRLRDIPETAGLPIIIASARGDVPDRISGLHAGADDYITKPVSMDELLARVVALLNRSQRAQVQTRSTERAKLLGFVGAKGGVGTTTLVLNVATLLAQQKKTVIAVELRPDQGTFAPQFKWRGGENLYHLLSRDLDQLSPKAIGARLNPAFTGLRILYGPQQVEEFGELDAARVASIIEMLGSMAEYVLIDLPYGFSDANRAAAQACDLMVVVMEPEPNSTSCAKAQFELLKSWDILGALVGIVLVNRSGVPGSMTLRDVTAQLGSEVIGVIPFVGEIAAAAVNQGLPMVIYKPEHNVTAAFKEVVRRLTADTLIGIRAF
jgi:pilus assembly protein CpaE